jgi:hypothetical protein
MPDQDSSTEARRGPDPLRRGLILGGGVATGIALVGAASGQETDTAP